MATSFKLGISTPLDPLAILRDILEYFDVDSEIGQFRDEEDFSAPAIGCTVFTKRSSRAFGDYREEFWHINTDILVTFRLFWDAELTEIFPILLGYVLKYMRNNTGDVILQYRDDIVLFRRSGNLFISGVGLWLETDCLEMIRHLEYDFIRPEEN
ncbi:MAG: hypothetical protein BroJett018_47690 [Chloroflexota bacterium]|nr:hypothetical protein [Chloroflexota bacterium]GIK66975.1 MAG: hypothetical protein BroJett018_47690 [Chloroflexota bacterium]